MRCCLYHRQIPIYRKSIFNFPFSIFNYITRGGAFQGIGDKFMKNIRIFPTISQLFFCSAEHLTVQILPLLFSIDFFVFCDIILIEDGGAAEISRICDARGRMAAVFFFYFFLFLERFFYIHLYIVAVFYARVSPNENIL